MQYSGVQALMKLENKMVVESPRRRDNDQREANIIPKIANDTPS